MKLLFLLLLLFSLGINAKTLNVGRDKEFTDLRDALNKCEEGDTIFIYPGTYDLESPDGINFINLKSGITLKGVDKFQVILKPKGDNPAYEALIKIIDKKNISIDGLTIISPYGNVHIKDSSNISVTNCIFKGFRWSTKKHYSLEVTKGSAFSGSSELLFKGILFDNCNPVSLLEGNKGSFTGNCLFNVENTNYWYLSKESSWSFSDIITHKTVLKKAHQHVDKIHNLAGNLPWIEKREGLSWGAVKALWMPLNKRIEPESANSKSFLDSLEQISDNSEKIDINIEVKEGTLIDKQGPEIYIEERQRFRDIKAGVPNDILKGRVIDVSGVESLVIYEKSAVLVDGKTPTLYKHEVQIKNGDFQQELELDEQENLITIEATDRKGNKSFSSLIVREQLPSSKKDDAPTIHLFKRKTDFKIITLKVPEIIKMPYIIVRGYIDFPESVSSIKVGSIPASLDKKGNFSAVYPLKKGENEIEVTVLSKNGQKESESFEIEAIYQTNQSDQEKPVIELTQTRSLDQKLTGKITDKSSVPLFIIDGNEVQLDKRGLFEYKLNLKPDENIIKMEAYDSAGNYTMQETKISGTEIYQSLTKDVEYHALVIGINNYKHLPDLKTPINDATAIKDILEKQYGFNVTMLKNANRKFIINQIEKLRTNLKPNHKLLIYYAGHGYFDEKTDRSFWLPADAEKEDSAYWISSLEIKTNLLYSNPKNILVVSDSCFSGTLSGKRYRSLPSENDTASDSIQTKLSRPCRLLLSSGGNEPVVDGNKNHSIFAEAFLWSLKEPPAEVFSVADIFPGIYEIVTNGDTKQKPDLEYIQETGHVPGGGFVFRKLKK